ncbi:MAG: P-loop NTPase [Spirochaetia bacterium]|jgi:flagellar biosynthesis protein FlhG|nr:P-loop NTPase [Spirochaetia bacterium]
MQVLPIASGKGGVGKSLFATNVAIALAQTGKKVILADLDLGASNLHLILGMGSIKAGIGSFLSNPDTDFNDIIFDTEYKNLKFIPGDGEIPGMANLDNSQKTKLVRELYMQEADYLILDLGAGTSFNTVDFFLSSSIGVIVTAPALTATLNAYLFLKNVVFRLMSTSFKKDSWAGKYFESLKQEGKNFQKIYIPKVIEKIRIEDPESYEIFMKSMSVFKPMLVMNMLEDPKDSQKAVKIRRSCKEYLGVNLEHLGIIYFDHQQEIALNSRLPIIAYKPNSVLSQAIYRIADKILEKGEEISTPLDISALNDSYSTASMEAEIDYDSKVEAMENLLHSGTLTEGDLVETIRSQQYEINSLKKENYFLKAQIVQFSQGKQEGKVF